jgi:hypothetical protein
MSARCRFAQMLWVSLLVVGLAGQAAFATTSHPSYFGTNVSFTGIQETSTFGDAEPLFGAPTGSSDQLTFSPTTFSASAMDASGFDQTGAQLQLDITATAVGATIDILLLSESGSADLSGPAGFGGTGAFATMAGFVTVLEVLGLPVAPVVISFNAGGLLNGSFTPGDLGTGLFALPGYAGVTAWSGNVAIDIASIVPNATKVKLSFDNELSAYSEADGNGATIQKDSVVITVIPEPGTFALVCGGFLALSLRGRSRRS